MATPHNYCPNCFSTLSQGKSPCENCQYGSHLEEAPIYLNPPFCLQDQYLIGRVLGHGGFGITYLGYDLNLQVRVAIKEYLISEFATRSQNGRSVLPLAERFHQPFLEGKKKFIAEARLLASFRSPNIIKIRQFFEANNTAYFVMEYQEGETLTEFVHNQGGRLSFEHSLSVLRPFFKTLEEIHDKNVFHRDIKPDNIYMTQAGEPILLDFGAAKQHLSEKTSSLLSFVTPGFAPLEQYSPNGILGPWTDIYSLAATLYFMLTGVVPPDAQALMFGNTQLPRPSSLGSDIPPPAEEWLLKGMALKWSQRPDTIKIWQEQLTQILSPSPAHKIADRERTAKENFLKIAILPRIKSNTLTYVQEEAIYASAAYMEIPLDQVKYLIEIALGATGATRQAQASDPNQTLEEREMVFLKKAEELMHFEELRQKEEALWWESEQAALAHEKQAFLEEQEKKQAELKHYEELRQQEEEMWWNAEQERLDKERQKLQNEQTQKEQEVLQLAFALEHKAQQMQRFEELRQKEEEMWWDAEQERLDQEWEKIKQARTQLKEEQNQLETEKLRLMAEKEIFKTQRQQFLEERAHFEQLSPNALDTNAESLG